MLSINLPSDCKKKHKTTIVSAVTKRCVLFDRYLFTKKIHLVENKRVTRLQKRLQEKNLFVS